MEAPREVVATGSPRLRRRRQGAWLGWAASDPKPRPSPPAAGPVLAPSRWRGIPVHRVQQVWSAALTAVRLAGGWVCWVAVIDGCRRSVLAWAVSIPLAVAWGGETWEPALRHGQPARGTTAPGAPCTRLACPARRQHAGSRRRLAGRR